MEAVAIRAVLNSVVQTTTTAITNEIGLILGVQKELFFIKEELEMMQAFLQAASTQNVKGIIVTTWIKQVQELAFDVEDCLQEASVHLMKKCCLHAPCLVWRRDCIARKIQVLKTRIEDVSKRNLRYNLINKENGGLPCDESASTRSITNVEALLVGLDEPKGKLVELILEEHVEHKEEPWKGKVISVVGMGGLGKTTLVREVYGCPKLRDKFKCCAWVTVLHPFNKDEFIESLFKQIPFDAQEIDNKGRIIEGNTVKPEELPKKTINEKLDGKVTGYLKDKKYLIVLDDLYNVSEWDKIKDGLPIVNGSRIIVTTRSRSLAESISHPRGNIHEMKKLAKDDALNLFFKAVYKTPNYHFDDKKMKDGLPHKSKNNMKNRPSSKEKKKEDSKEQKKGITISITMKSQADLIIENCGRLPLAIVTIGGYLATKSKTSVEWKAMHKQLSSELADNQDLGVVMKTVLTSSYDGMPYHLKPCLLYLSVFHNHKGIRRSRIIRRWMADGYVMEGHHKTAEEVGKDYFHDLLGRSLIEPSQMSTMVGGDVKRCYNIHDMMYELIVTKAVDENIVSLLKDEKLITRTGKLRHLVVVGGPCKGDEVLERVKLSHMRSVSIFGEVGDYLTYPRMKLVRVLDLEGTLDLRNQHLRCVEELRHLKFLGLRGTKITKLPDSLGKLSELETLDIRNTAVVQLPTGLTKLQKLSYLRAGFDLYKNPNISLMGKGGHIVIDCINFFSKKKSNLAVELFVSFLSLFIPQNIKNLFSSYGVRAPRGIGELKSLKILGMIDIGQSKGLAKEMQNLTNLSKLAVTGFTEENGKTLAKVIDGLKHLRSLVLAAVDALGLQCCLESVSSPPKYLQSLKLYSPLNKLPHWISSLENLEKIHFRNTFLTEEIEAIGKLQNLMILYMSYNSFRDRKKLCFHESTFPMLQVMILEGIEELESLSIKQTALESLEQLKISKCWSIGQNGVSGLDFLVQLKEMEVVVSESERDKMFVSNLQKQLPRLPKKPVLRVFND